MEFYYYYYYYFKIAADRGDVNSMKLCSALLMTGNGVPVDEKERMRYLLMAAQKGDLYSLTILKMMRK